MTELSSNQNEKTNKGSSKKLKGYMIFMFVYMVFYEFYDSYTTSYHTSVVSYIQADLGINTSEWFSIQAIASIGLFAVLFIQYLADVVGRKPMIIIAFFGMGFAALLMYLSNSVSGFTIGFFFLWMFFSSDLWVIIVSEESPEEKRGKYTYLITVLGALGVIAIPVCRSIFITTTPDIDPTVWRGMNLFAMIAMPLALLGFGLKETSAFKARKAANKKSDKITGLGKFKIPFTKSYITKTISFMIIGFILGVSAAAVSTFESFITPIVGDEDIVTLIVTFSTLGTLLFYGVTAIFSDKIGRKPLIFIFIAMNITSILPLVFLSEGWSIAGNFTPIYILALLNNGSFWSVFMLSKTYCVENFPTEIRGTASGLRAFSYALGITGGSLLYSVLATFMNLGSIFIISAVLSGVVVILVVAIKLPETKGLKIVE